MARITIIARNPVGTGVGNRVDPVTASVGSVVMAIVVGRIGTVTGAGFTAMRAKTDNPLYEIA